MAGRHVVSGLLLALAGLPACTSRDERAAAAAAVAADALQANDLATASGQIGRALAARDDVGDYWMLSGRIALARRDYGSAFTAFETALTLDHGNIEALTRLCQIANSTGQPKRADHYADELTALQPGDTAALNVRAALALERGDKAGATKLLDQLLAVDPRDAAALVTRSRLLSADGNNAAAARALEASLSAPGDPIGRLEILKQIYLKAADAAGWRRTIARIAQADPRSAPARLDLARSRYEAGDPAGGFAASQAALALKPGDVGTADAALHLWLAQGAAAMPAAAIATAAAGSVPETRAAFAAYANALGRPDLALAALGDAGAGAPATAVNDAKVAQAQAQALLDRRDVANAAVAAVLAVDADQPRALALRGTLRAEAGDRRGAVGDLRHALSADPGDANARLALADLQVADGDAVLAAATLGDGLGDPGADSRLATRLAGLLHRQGRAPDAAAVITEYQRNNPFAPRPPG